MIMSTDSTASVFTIQVLLFASAREAADNVSSVHVELNEGSDTTNLRYASSRTIFTP